MARIDYRTVIEPARDDSGIWCLAVIIDGGVYADGEEGTLEEAQRKARASLDEWKTMNS